MVAQNREKQGVDRGGTAAARNSAREDDGCKRRRGKEVRILNLVCRRFFRRKKRNCQERGLISDRQINNSIDFKFQRKYTNSLFEIYRL